MADHNINPPLIIAAGAIIPPLCFAIVCLRFHVRRKQTAKFGLDDWLTIPALILLIGMSAAALRGVALHAVGNPVPMPLQNKPSEQQETARVILWAVELMYFPALGFTKLSFLFFYRRVFITNASGPHFPRITLAIIILVIIWIIGFFFSYLFICNTHPSIWWTTISQEENYCLDGNKLHLGYAISDCLLDLIIILIPVPLVWELRLSWPRKVAVLGIFALGVEAFAASITRLFVFIERLRLHRTSNSTATNAIYWSITELGVGLIAACLPPLAPLLKTHFLYTIFQKIGRIAAGWRSSNNGLRASLSRSKVGPGTERDVELLPVEINVIREFQVGEEMVKGYGERNWVIAGF